MRSLLVFSGSNDRAVYAVCRVASRLGVDFHIVASGFDDRILLGRYRNRVCYLRQGRVLDLQVLTHSIESARKHGANPDAELVILPSSEFLNRFLLSVGQSALSSLGCVLPMADAQTYATLSDKANASAWAEKMGLAVPQRLQDFSVDLLPLVAKPLCNQGPDGEILYPQLLFSVDELEAFKAQDRTDLYFPQEMIVGPSWYLLGYMPRDGRARCYSQCNIAQQPHGKSVVLARSDTFHGGRIAQKTLAAMKAFGFFGLFMVEFKGPRDTPAFIEINPRPWGPLQLCVDAGSGIVEAFFGEWLFGDSEHFSCNSSCDRHASYAWFGGMLQTRRSGGRLSWHSPDITAAHWLQVLRALPHDVYLRPDSWRVFLRELRE